MSICDSARRMASDGVAAFASHHAKRGLDNLPGRNVIRSEIWLLMEFVGCSRNLTKKVLDVFDLCKVPVVQIVQFSGVVWSWKAGGPFGKVRQCALNLAYHVSVIVHGGSMLDRHLKNSLSFRAGRLPVIPATTIY